MKCPACFDELTEIQVGAVAVDVCDGGCGGVWFDAFELARVDEPHEAAGEPLLHIRRAPSVSFDLNRKRACPRCAGIKLLRHRFGPHSTVQVDHCPNCAGHWLDAGELEKIRAEARARAEHHAAAPASSSMEVIRYLYRLRIQVRAEE